MAEAPETSGPDRLPLRLGILANGSPDSVRTWSGVPYSVKQALTPWFEEVVYVPSPTVPWLTLSKAVNYRVHRLLKKRFVAEWLTANAKHHAKTIRAELTRARAAGRPIDVLLAVGVDQQIAYLHDAGVPIVHHSDSTFRGIAEYYSTFSDLWKFGYRNGDEINRRALQNADLSIYPARWSRDSAVNDYGVDPGKVMTVPYGSNLLDPPSRDQVLDTSVRDRCRLLWVGVEWDRKGGQLTYDAMVELNRRGVDAEMVLVGAAPPAGCDHPKLTVHGFLSKQVPEELELYKKLWRQAAFFTLPTRGETFGMVFSEAAANGLPSIATVTGGVPDAVQDGVSGRLLPLDAPATAYADVIEEIWNDRPRYETMIRQTRDRYEQVLNWDAWAAQVAPRIGQVVRAAAEANN